MYKRINEISGFNGFIVKDEKIYTHRCQTGTLQELSFEGAVLWESQEVGIWAYNVYQDNIIFDLRDKDKFDTYIYNKTTKHNWCHLPIRLSGIIEKSYYINDVLYNFNTNGILLFNLQRGK